MCRLGVYMSGGFVSGSWILHSVDFGSFKAWVLQRCG